jgi:hypothetical protein
MTIERFKIAPLTDQLMAILDTFGMPNVRFDIQVTLR